MLTRASRQRLVSCLALAGALGVATPVFAAKYALSAVLKGDTDRQLIVFFAQPLPPLDTVTCAAGTTCPWSVVVIDKTLTEKLISVTAAAVPKSMPNFGQFQAVALELGAAVPADAVRVSVTLLRNNAPVQTLATPEARKKELIEPVDDPDDATLYFSGIVAPAAGDHTTYTIDTRAGWILRQAGVSALSLNGELKADKRPQADPDSANVFVQADRYGRTWVTRWDVGGLEFDREGKVVNLMSRPSIAAPLSHAFLVDKKDDSGNMIPTVRATLGVNLGLGMELGANTKHDPAVDPASFVFRIAPRLSTYLVVPAPVVKKVVFSAEYTVRVLTQKELFRETRNLPDKADPVPYADRRPRHYATAGVKLMLTEWFGVKGEYEYGSLPPAFQFVNHSGKIGLVFQAKQVRVQN